MGMSKQIKTSESTHSQSSDTHIEIDLNNDDPYEAPTRPMGRDITKRKLKGAQSSLSEVEEIMSDIKGLDAKLDGFWNQERKKKGTVR